MKWILQLGVRDRSGILNQLTSVFAERGISLDAVLCTAEHTEPTVILAFTAPARVKDHLRRVLERLPDVARVREFPADSETVRTFALVSIRTSGLDRALLEGLSVVTEEPGRLVADCVGSPAEIDRRLAALEDAGALEKVIALSAAL
jgi:acetolactate synthase small subunit